MLGACERQPGTAATVETGDPAPLASEFHAACEKIFLDAPATALAETAQPAEIQLARNEYEAIQLVVRPLRDLADVRVAVGQLRAVGGETLPATDVDIAVVAYVRLDKTVTHAGRTGWHPDPLLPNQPLALSRHIPQPYLITLRTRATTRAGTYHGPLTISVDGKVQQTIDLRVQVWNFTLPQRSSFKSSSFPGWRVVAKAWPASLGYPAPTQDQMKQRYLQLADLGFRNRLPPLGFLANGLVSQNDKQGLGYTRAGYPTHDDGPHGSDTFNARRTDEMLDFLLDRGANHFFIAFTSDIFRDPGSTAARQAVLLRYLKEYTAHLRTRGLLHMAYVYGVDEPWGEAVQHTRDTYTLIKKEVGADVRFLQNTNQNQKHAIGRFLGYFDALDINLGFYDATDAAGQRRRHPQQLSDFWWNVNFWPATRPNLFLEYPLVDARIIGPMSFKYNMQGFEYWDLMSLSGVGDYHPLAHNELRVGWRVGEKSLDGTLVYPGKDGRYHSSLRMESFRDGMEDQEYLYLLRQVDPAHPLLAVPPIRGLTAYDDNARHLLDFRRSLGEILSRAGEQGRLP
jgi:hypothetical protein